MGLRGSVKGNKEHFTSVYQPFETSLQRAQVNTS